MKKLLALAALAGAMMVPAAIAPLPAAAAEIPGKCIVFPLLQADCRDAIRDATDDVLDAAGASAEAIIAAPAQASVPVLSCARTPGGKALFACSVD